MGAAGSGSCGAFPMWFPAVKFITKLIANQAINYVKLASWGKMRVLLQAMRRRQRLHPGW